MVFCRYDKGWLDGLDDGVDSFQPCDSMILLISAEIVVLRV